MNEWEPLFNGEDLTGWEIVGAGNWYAEDEQIHVTRKEGETGGGWLVTKENVGQKSFKTKKKAVKAARRMAKKDRPSLLIVERKKQSKFGQSGVADWTHYSSR